MLRRNSELSIRGYASNPFEHTLKGPGGQLPSRPFLRVWQGDHSQVSMPGCRDAGMPGCRDAGMPGCWDAGVRRDAGIPEGCRGSRRGRRRAAGKRENRWPQVTVSDFGAGARLRPT
jgi:hypothetical protein